MSVGKKRSGFQITSVTLDYPGEAMPPALPASQSAPVDSSPSQQGSFSQPTTPLSPRKYNSQDAPAQGAGSPHSSRFRVVRLAQGRDEPYRRGRWTCTDFLEREEGAGLRRVMDSLRQAHSLESLETIGLGGVGGGALQTHVRALRAGNLVHSQGTSHLLAQPMAGQGEGLVGVRPLLLHSGPPSPTHHAPPPSPRLRYLPPPLRLEVDAAGRSLLRGSLSQPSSPGAPQSRDGVFQPSLTPTPTPSAFSLAQSIFSPGGAFHLAGDDSGSSSSMVAIDNKIEQAMDLVKTHLMLAVREEVELLRGQISELTERNAQLERENYILRALRDRD
ncbi:TSC22 domain family protein 4-like [Osmerus eperlanus]|uniref:TSC22 domain family protein 4-like n=1 Tax=Osmerus eperlanus TaxID=29151 RepID=UPI002E0F3605